MFETRHRSRHSCEWEWPWQEDGSRSRKTAGCGLKELGDFTASPRLATLLRFASAHFYNFFFFCTSG